MQNPYTIERFVQERTHEARALAELQALRRQAAAARRLRRAGALRSIFAALFSRRAEAPVAALQERR